MRDLIVLGVDPGSLRTGWGIVRRVGARVQAIAAGVIHTEPSDALEARLCAIHVELTQVIAVHQPTAMAVEDVFSKHARSALTLGQARGVVLLCGAQAELAVSAYPPAVVKRAIAGRGQTPKPQLARIVAAMLGLRTLPPLDATDALAIAITHANALGTNARATERPAPQQIPPPSPRRARSRE